MTDLWQRERRNAGILALLATTWCALLFAPPFLQASGYDTVAVLTRMVLDPICHQIPGRSLHIAGNPMAVCSRCAGIYAGFALGCWVFLVKRRGLPSNHRHLFAAAALVMTELTAEIFGVIDGSIATGARTVTGTLFGLIVSRYLAPIIVRMIVDVSKMLSRRERRSESHAEAG